MTVLICRTCPRYDPRAAGQFSDAFTAALRRMDDRATAIRNVQCLGGCPDHGVVALDDPGKARVRFTALGPGDADAIIAADLAYGACETGHPDDWHVPEQLRAHLSSITLKRIGR